MAWQNTMKHWTAHVCIAMLLWITGCVAVDSRVGKEEVRRVDSVDAFCGVYGNTPTYLSERAGFVGVSDFASVVGAHYTKADSFRIRAIESKGLAVELMRDGRISYEKMLLFDDGLVLTEQGILKLPKETESGSHDSPVIGVASRQLTIFLNGDDNLVLVNSGGGAGFVGIFPIALYGKLMSIFPRVE